jgi:hypothetical protein
MNSLVNDYKNLRTIPALLGIFFAVASMYQFGGIETFKILWGINYTLTTEHAMFLSLGTYVVAFASSETKQFEAYEDWEKAVIAAGPALIVGHQYVTWVSDQFAAHDPLLPIVGFLLAVASWGVAVR